VDRDDLKKVRRVELLARLELLDELIRDQARRAEFASEMRWDATPCEQRSKLLRVSRQQYVEALRQLLCNDAARDEDANDGAGGSVGGVAAAHPPAEPGSRTHQVRNLPNPDEARPATVDPQAKRRANPRRTRRAH
jgi:hypothetical protein